MNITFIVFKAIWADQNLLALFLFKFVGGQNFYRLKAIWTEQNLAPFTVYLLVHLSGW